MIGKPIFAAVVLLAFIGSYVALCAFRPAASVTKLLDMPGTLKLHEGQVPLVGGIAILFGYVLGLTVYPSFIATNGFFVLAGAFVVVTGALDDRFDLGARLRLAIQIIIALIAAFGAGLVVDNIGAPFFTGVIELGWLAIPFTVLVFVGGINAWNMIDGIDGLASVLAFIGFAFLLTAAGPAALPLQASLLALLCAIAAFFLFNLPLRGVRRQRTFLGDAGSMFLGLAIVWHSLVLSQGETAAISPVTALWFVALPVYEVLSTTIRRALHGQSPLSGDRHHLHHVLQDHGWSKRQILIALSALAILGGAVGLSSHLAGVSDGLMFSLFALIGFAYFLEVRHLAKASKDNGERPPHILFLSDNFPPEVNAPASRTFEHCREWVRAGNKVTVISCAPNFPHGKVFEGYRNKLWQRETIEGIEVIRVWSYISANQGFGKRSLDYLSYMVTGFLASLFVRRVDVVIGTSPQFFTVCAALVTSWCKRVAFVFELRDIWPESIKAVGAFEDGILIRWFEKLELFLYRQADAIVSVTHSFKENLISRGIEGNKIHVVTNGVDLTRFKPRPKDAELVARYGLENKFVAGYIGTHGMAHALDTVLDAARNMRQHPDGKDYAFVLLGDGAERQRLVERARRMQLDNVIFIDSVAKSDVARHWSLLDASIIHLRATPLFRTVIPSKLFESMGMGIPILHCVAGESAAIVEQEKVGLTVEPENDEDLCTKLITLKREQGLYAALQANCAEAAPHYERAKLAGRMEIIVTRLIKRLAEKTEQVVAGKLASNQGVQPASRTR